MEEDKDDCSADSENKSFPRAVNGPCRDRKPQIQLTISGGDDEGVPPVPIPNTEVKPFSADGTWLETARESRSLPDSITVRCKKRTVFH